MWTACLSTGTGNRENGSVRPANRVNGCVRPVFLNSRESSCNHDKQVQLADRAQGVHGLNQSNWRLQVPQRLPVIHFCCRATATTNWVVTARTVHKLVYNLQFIRKCIVGAMGASTRNCPSELLGGATEHWKIDTPPFSEDAVNGKFC